MKNLSRALAAALLAILCVVPLAAQTTTIGTDTNGHAAIRYMLSDEAITTGVGTVSGTGVAVAETGNIDNHITTFTFTALSLTMTDATTAGSHGSQLIYTFPVAGIVIRGASCNLATTAGSGGIADTGAVVESLGSVTTVTDNAALTSTEADIIASFAGTLAAGVGVFQKLGGAVAIADGSVTASKIYLNAAVPDAGSSASDTLAFTGTCVVKWYSIADPTP